MRNNVSYNVHKLGNFMKKFSLQIQAIVTYHCSLKFLSYEGRYFSHKLIIPLYSNIICAKMHEVNRIISLPI